MTIPSFSSLVYLTITTSFFLPSALDRNVYALFFLLSALDRNDYNHITATYFLLAERKLRAARQRTAEDVLQDHQHRRQMEQEQLNTADTLVPDAEECRGWTIG